MTTRTERTARYLASRGDTAAISYLRWKQSQRKRDRRTVKANRLWNEYATQRVRLIESDIENARRKAYRWR